MGEDLLHFADVGARLLDEIHGCPVLLGPFLALEENAFSYSIGPAGAISEQQEQPSCGHPQGLAVGHLGMD